MLGAGLYHVDEFIYNLETSFICNIAGDLGTGKTLLSVVLAFDLWRRRIVDKIYSNFPLAGRYMDYQIGAVNKKFVMILDEPARVLDSRKYTSNKTSDWKRDLRKREAYLILPGVDDVDVRLRGLQVARLFMAGNLLWSYRYLRTTKTGESSGWFILWRPSYFFGAYSTEYSPTVADFQVLYDVMTQGIDDEIEYEKSVMMREQALYNPVEVETETYGKFIVPKSKKGFLSYLARRK